MAAAGAVATSACAMALTFCGGPSFTAGGSDASIDAATATSEASIEAATGTPEASAVGDSAHLADSGSSTDGGSWCSGQTANTFCEDFDEYSDVTALLGAWSTFEQTGGGSFAFDTVNAPSPPNALEVMGPNGAKVVVIKTFPLAKQPAVLRLDFDLRLDSSGSVAFLSAVGLAAIAFGNDLSNGYAALAITSGPTLSGAWTDATDAGVSDAGTFKTSNATGTFPAGGVWAARYAIEVDYTSTAGCVQIYEGITPLLSPCLALPPHLLHPATVSIALGDYAGGLESTGVISVEFDNVTFDVQ
jgi:hypothetical protein